MNRRELIKLAEERLLEQVNQGDLDAIKYFLSTYAKDKKSMDILVRSLPKSISFFEGEKDGK